MAETKPVADQSQVSDAGQVLAALSAEQKAAVDAYISEKFGMYAKWAGRALTFFGVSTFAMVFTGLIWFYSWSQTVAEREIKGAANAYILTADKDVDRIRKQADENMLAIKDKGEKDAKAIGDAYEGRLSRFEKGYKESADRSADVQSKIFIDAQFRATSSSNEISRLQGRVKLHSENVKATMKQYDDFKANYDAYSADLNEWIKTRKMLKEDVNAEIKKINETKLLEALTKVIIDKFKETEVKLDTRLSRLESNEAKFDARLSLLESTLMPFGNNISGMYRQIDVNPDGDNRNDIYVLHVGSVVYMVNIGTDNNTKSRFEVSVIYQVSKTKFISFDARLTPSKVGIINLYEEDAKYGRHLKGDDERSAPQIWVPHDKLVKPK